MEERITQRMENLAPAGSMESLHRAVSGGADAVYLGFSAFSARAGAGNFDEEALREAVRYCHLHGVRVHVAVNILVKDRELQEVDRVLQFLEDAGADAVLVQDLGVMDTVLSRHPKLSVHASTQMTIHNLTGASWCRMQGMSRVVLARECSLSEIRKCCEEDIEIEVFGHGALCVCVSGQCLMSSSIGERSGNRGRCAQPCRLPYVFDGKEGAWLSPRDICMREHLGELQDAGVKSVKLEGRLKRPEYVEVVTESYRRGLEAPWRRVPEDEMESLRQMFQRGSLMPGYAMGTEDAGVIDEKHPRHTGIEVGEVLLSQGQMALVRLYRDLDDGDQLCFGMREKAEMTYSGPSGRTGDTVRIRLRPGLQAKKGEKVHRLISQRQLDEAMARLEPVIQVRGRLTAIPGESLRFTVTDGTSEITETGETVQAAEKRALTPDAARGPLMQTGDTPFVFQAEEDLEVETRDAFVPVSLLKEIRRRVLDALEEKRISANTGTWQRRPPRRAGRLRPVYSMEGIRSAIVVRERPGKTSPGSLLIWSPEDYREDRLRAALRGMPEGIWIALPRVCEEDTLQQLRCFILANRRVLGGVVLGSVGQLGMRLDGIPVAAGPGIPVFNHRTADFLKKAGVSFGCVSPELCEEEIRLLMEASELPLLVPSSGRVQLMLLHHCPARTALGLKKGHRDCRMCDEKAKESLVGRTLTDRKGEAYPLLRQRLPEGCLIRLMALSQLDLTERVQKNGWIPLHLEGSGDGGKTTTGHFDAGIL